MKFLAILALVTLAACGKEEKPSQPPEPVAAVKHHDAAPSDAGTVLDAFLGPTPGLVTCYAGATFPSQECDLSTTYCCWAVYVPPPTGSCQPNATGCTHNIEHCDGPEDCAAGQGCYGHNVFDGEMWHWELACAASPIDPADQVLCRLGGAACPAGKSCVTANSAGLADWMATQYVCH